LIKHLAQRKPITGLLVLRADLVDLFDHRQACAANFLIAIFGFGHKKTPPLLDFQKKSNKKGIIVRAIFGVTKKSF
jgi:hypothetical protein